ncbi:hypothetical protein DF3PB_4280002 [uncultured Defluviicoccus sp.]|uniref:Uncharacterized protein n=1 Tax=metagenome TaxID=256318 RepID=A0A380TI71_9ZZZZ|nr:hypothetical protein DF3PB_4280002 [uncultured Defluviicoccus sp.]
MNTQLCGATGTFNAQHVAALVHVPRVALAAKYCTDGLVVKLPKMFSIRPFDEAPLMHA